MTIRIWWIVALWGFAMLIGSLGQRDDRRAEAAHVLGHLPRGEYLRLWSLGYQQLVADFYWLQMVQVLGADRPTAEEFDWLYHALDVITTVDPHFVYAFQVGGIVLTEVAGRVDLSNRLLEKGLAANPETWWIPFNLGYNHFFYLHRTEEAAHYMTLAARLPGRPEYLPRLAARMHAEAGSPRVAKDLLQTVADTPDGQVRAVIQTRIMELQVEEDLLTLEQAISTYRQEHSRAPRHLEDVVAAGYLAHIPSEPFGGVYQLDPRTGAVRSSTHPTRLHVYRPGDGNTGSGR